MATFDCTYLDESGITQSVSRFGADKSSAASALRDEGVEPLTVVERVEPGTADYTELKWSAVGLKCLAAVFSLCVVVAVLTIGMDSERSVYIIAVCLPCSALCLIARYAVLALRDVAINTRGK